MCTCKFKKTVAYAPKMITPSTTATTTAAATTIATTAPTTTKAPKIFLHNKEA